jgi:hypothetical protein
MVGASVVELEIMVKTAVIPGSDHDRLAGGSVAVL